jgi:hypothetical protein
MSTLAAKAIVGAHRVAVKVSGVTATYRRGDDEITGLRLLPANSSVGMRALREQVTFGARTPGFKLELAKLLFEETQWEPTLGDELEVTYPAGARTYTLKNGPNKRPWDWSDDYQQIITIYTVE